MSASPTYDELFGELEASVKEPRKPSAVADLSPEQSTACRADVLQSAMVFAGAGSGKTRLLVERTVHLLRKGVRSEHIAVVTFTKKAAQELKHRVSLRMGAQVPKLQCSTVHSLAYKLHHKKVELASEEFRASLAEDLQVLFEDELGERSAGELLLEIDRRREQRDESEGAWPEILAAYEQALEDRGLHDFTTLLKTQPRPLFSHLLVDETQDLTDLQWAYLQKTLLPGGCFWFVGDIDQSIYAFRGSKANIMQELRAQCALEFTLSTNYRSARKILAHANSVIGFNSSRLPIAWEPSRQLEGSVDVSIFESADEELEAVATWLQQSKDRRAVLARTNRLIQPLREAGLRALTIHEAKGLEWPEVWLLGCDSATLPHPMGDLEEERRLFYVAMTRACDKLRLSYAKNRSENLDPKKARNPSPFLFEAQALSV